MPGYRDDRDPGYNPYMGGATQPPPPVTGGPVATQPLSGGSAGWLPPGAVLNPDGSVRLADGRILPAPGQGFTRNPQTGVIERNQSNQTGPGGQNAPTAPLSLHDAYANFTRNNTPTSQSLGAFLNYLRQNGYPNAQFATHAGGQQSDDKLVINGRTYDFIRDVGGQNAGWQEPDWAGGGGGGGGDGNPNTDPNAVYAALNSSPLTRPWDKEFSYPDWKPPAAWTPPTEVTEQNDPGYRFRLQQGQQALEHAAAARGTLLSGQTMKDLTDYMQNAASAEYGNVYARGLTDYQTQYGASQNDWLTNYNKAEQAYQQAYNIFENNQAKQFNRLAAMAGYGQSAAGQLNQAGLGYAGQYGNTAMGIGNTVGGIYQGVGNANAAGQVGAGNAYGNFFGNIGNYAMMYPYMRQPNYNPYASGYAGGGYGMAPNTQFYTSPGGF